MAVNTAMDMVKILKSGGNFKLKDSNTTLNTLILIRGNYKKKAVYRLFFMCKSKINST